MQKIQEAPELLSCVWQQLPLLGLGVSLTLAGHQLGRLRLQAEAADGMLDERSFSLPFLEGMGQEGEGKRESNDYKLITILPSFYMRVNNPRLIPSLKTGCVPFVEGPSTCRKL